MKLQTVLLVTVALVTGVHSYAAAQAPVHAWSHLHGGTSDQYGQAVAVDSDGNVVVAGTFWNTIDAGGGVLTSAGLTDVFLAKFDAAGVHLWSRRFGSSNLENATGVAVDADGNIALTGYFRATVDFGGGGLSSAGSSDVFLAMYDPTGTHLWSRRFGDANADQGRSVAFDPHGNVVLAGNVNGSVDFGGGPLASAGMDAFAASFDALGAHRWSRLFGDGDAQDANSVATGSDGRVAIGGRMWGSADFGGGAITSAGGPDAFVAMFDSTGAHQWSRRFGDAADQFCHSVTIDANGNMWATGSFKGALDAGGGPLTSAGDLDVFAVKLTATGAHAASVRFGDALAQTGWWIDTDTAGNVFLTGEFAGSVDFGGGALTSAGGNDIFVAMLSDAAAHRWSRRFGDTANDAGYAIAARASGFVFTGLARGSVDFGGGTLTSAGGADACVVSFAEAPSRVSAGAENRARVEAWPNPFNPATTIRYTVPSRTAIQLVVYDATGERVATLVDREQDAGIYSVEWNGRADDGAPVSSGVYFARMTGAGDAPVCKLVLLK